LEVIWNYLDLAVKKNPHKPFLYFGDNKITYKELDEISNRLADSFIRIGLKHGDNIAIVALNQPEWLYTFFAATKVGIGLIALNVRYRAAEFEYMLNNARAKALVCLNEFAGFNYSEFFSSIREKIPGVQRYIFLGGGFPGGIPFESLIKGVTSNLGVLENARQAINENDTAIIIYTSGTTGKPKGVMITNKSMLASATAEASHIAMNENDVKIGHMPLNHVGGITSTILTSLIKCGSVVLIPSFRPDIVLSAIEKHKATIFLGVPTMYVMMMEFSGFREYNLSSLRIVHAGASNVEPYLCDKIKVNFPNAILTNIYGLSEASGSCVLTRLSDDKKKVVESIGVPIGNFCAKIVDNHRNELELGEVGELAIKGDCVAKGYYGMEKETSETFGHDRWLYTGDMGYMDTNGYIYLKGRKKEMYIQGGFNVYPVEIENLLTKHPKVSVAAGVGVPDPVFGEVGRYYIVPRAGTEPTAEELMVYCQENLADYKVPKEFVFVKELPLTPAGKIQKSQLKQQYEESMKRVKV